MALTWCGPSNFPELKHNKTRLSSGSSQVFAAPLVLYKITCTMDGNYYSVSLFKEDIMLLASRWSNHYFLGLLRPLSFCPRSHIGLRSLRTKEM